MLKLGDRGEEVKKLQRQLYITGDGIFGSATLSAVINFQKDNDLVDDGVVGPKTWAKFEDDTQYFTLANVCMIKTKPQNVEVVLLGNTLHGAKKNGINGTFFDTPRPTLPQSCWGLVVNKGEPIGPNAHITDWKGTKRGTVWFDGENMHCERINNYKEAGYMEWGISGVMLLPDYNRWVELYLSDIFRKTNHTAVGFDVDGNVVLFVQKNCSISQLIQTCKKFSLVGAISLDGGASSQLRFSNKGLASSRKINSAVLVRG